MKIRPLHAADFYKTGHVKFYDEDTEVIYQNFCPRSTKWSPQVDGIPDKIVLTGLQYFVKYFLIDVWNQEFFQKPKEGVLRRYQRRMDTSLGKGVVGTSHIAALHDLGYLPIKIKALPEGSVVNPKIPFFTIQNTVKGFGWIVGYLEDALSCLIWKSCTAATTSWKYKQIGVRAAKETGVDPSFVDFAFHDFSLRGTCGFQDAVMIGMAHLLSFKGTDNMLALDALEDYYNADADIEYIGGGVPANEHSCVCNGKKENEFKNYKRWITKTFPKGVLSLVSDTWDLWKVITEYLVALKQDILNRDGKVVIRPDSSKKTPLEIICGDPEADPSLPEYKGVVELLWDIFGGTVNAAGYKELDPHIGMLYGEAISLDLSQKIYTRLKEKGFASNCCFYGIGSYSFVASRDSQGWACKATASVVGGEFRELYKEPVTDSGVKKSAKGLLRVDKVGNDFVLKDQCTWEEEAGGELKTVFLDGKLLVDQSLSEIRARLTV